MGGLRRSGQTECKKGRADLPGQNEYGGINNTGYDFDKRHAGQTEIYLMQKLVNL